MQEYFIEVTMPDPEGLRRGSGVQYIGWHTFLGKRTAPTPMGGVVPVYVYGTPDEIIQAAKEIGRLAQFALDRNINPDTGKTMTPEQTEEARKEIDVFLQQVRDAEK